MSQDALRKRLRAIAKAELHVHLEGSLAPETVWALAQRYKLPLGLTSLEACRELYRFDNFAGFIHAIRTVAQLLREPADYAAAVGAMARYLQAQGVTYSEVFVSIGILLWRKVEVEPYWEAIEAARTEAEAATGVRIRWLFDAVRQLGAEPFEQVVEWAIRLAPWGGVIGIGIGGDEAQRAAKEFAFGYQRARAAGLHTTIHAGETRGPEEIWEVLRELEPERIGHGLRAFEDPRLVEHLIERRIALDICPTSNHKTGALGAHEAHPVRRYFEQGVEFSISSDDPGIFGCTLLDEYAWLAERAGFSAEELEALARGSFGRGFGV